jgi:hypothetical protein
VSVRNDAPVVKGGVGCCTSLYKFPRNPGGWTGHMETAAAGTGFQTPGSGMLRASDPNRPVHGGVDRCFSVSLTGGGVYPVKKSSDSAGCVALSTVLRPCSFFRLCFLRLQNRLFSFPCHRPVQLLSEDCINFHPFHLTITSTISNSHPFHLTITSTIFKYLSF